MDITSTKPLLPPQIDTGHLLLRLLRDRKSSREFDPRPLPDPVLSELLWAANGVNRPEDGRRTAPSACNWQEIDVYVTSAEGAYRYDAFAHALDPVSPQDLRKQTGGQDFVATAPLNLVFIADLSRISGVPQERAELLAAEDASFVSQNVYLYCAAAGLATVVRATIDREALAKALGLREDQRIILAQTVGYPAA
jgi:SagB-type dehydrogenase family enzyme